jgi:transcriptional regulator with XRE-family HTH domain
MGGVKVITDKTRIEYLAENIRRGMQRNKWSQEQLEAESGVPQASISQILNSKVDPRITAVFKLASALDVSVDVLLSEPREKISQKSS